MENKKNLIENLTPLFMDIGDTMFYLLLKNLSKMQDLTITQLKVLKLLEEKEKLK